MQPIGHPAYDGLSLRKSATAIPPTDTGWLKRARFAPAARDSTLVVAGRSQYRTHLRLVRRLRLLEQITEGRVCATGAASDGMCWHRSGLDWSDEYGAAAIRAAPVNG